MILTSCHPPLGVFRGHNLMTPEFVGYYLTTHNGRTAYVELSRGRGLAGGDLYGVTVRKADGGRFDPDPSTCYHSIRAAHRAIEELPST